MIDSHASNKVIDLLKKLITHQKSAEEIGNLDEAAAFAGKVAELLTKHNLSMSEVETFAYIAANPIGETNVEPKQAGQRKRAHRVRWQDTLAGVIADAHFCHMVIIGRSNTTKFVGRDSDRQVAVYVYCYLARVALRLCEQEWNRFQVGRRKQTTKRRRRFEQSFYQGFTSAIWSKYNKAKGTENPVTDGALIYIEKTEQQINDYLTGRVQLVTVRKQTLREDEDAKRAGWRSGCETDLPKPGIGDSNRSIRGLLNG